jgi:hypothetical protein
MTTDSNNELLNAPNKDEILKTLETYHRRGDVIELRIIGTKRERDIHSAYYDNFETLADEVVTFDLTHHRQEYQYYFTPNELIPEMLLTREPGVIVYRPQTTKNPDVSRRRWFLIDCDPIRRTSKLSATNDEKEKAYYTAIKIREFLTSHGFPAPAFADSGNGYWLSYAVDIPTTPATMDRDNTDVFKKALAWIDANVEHDGVTIDKGNVDPNRVIKLFGTPARKGINSDDRPYRISKLIQVPDKLETVTIEQLKTMADEARATSSDSVTRGILAPDEDIQALLNRCDLSTSKIKEDNNGTLYELATCPFNPEHINSSFIKRFNTGVITFGCLHDSDSEKGIRELRELRDPQYVGVSVKENTEDHQIPESDIRYARALEILKIEDPIKFTLDTFNTIHVGDRDVGEGILLGTSSQSVQNSLGLQSKLTGDSGKGKSDAAKKMMHLHPPEYVVYASLTDKAIWYHPNLRAGATIFSDDAEVSKELEGIIKRATSNFQRLTERILPVKDKYGNYTGATQSVPERLNWLLTSVRTQGSDELIKRQMGYDVDTSDSQDMAYIVFVKQQAKKATLELPINDDILICREIIRILKENEDGTPRLIGVDISFIDDIEWTDTENRRNFNIFIDMVRGFAMLRFMQRERNDDGNIVATIDDFNDAKRHYSARAGMQALHLDETQKRFCQQLAQLGGEADTMTMQYKMKLNRQAVYKIATGLEGIYWRFSSEKRTVPTGDDEKNTTTKRFYMLNFDGRVGFTLDEYSTVVYLKKGDDK